MGHGSWMILHAPVQQCISTGAVQQPYSLPTTYVVESAGSMLSTLLRVLTKAAYQPAKQRAGMSSVLAMTWEQGRERDMT